MNYQYGEIELRGTKCLVTKMPFISKENMKEGLNYYELFTESKFDDEPFSIVSLPRKENIELKYCHSFGYIISKEPLSMVDSKEEFMLTDTDINEIRYSERNKYYDDIENWINKQ